MQTSLQNLNLPSIDAIQAEMARRGLLVREKLSDTLHAKQRVAFESDATEILFGGAAGPGKSHLLRVAAIEWCEEIAGLQVFLFRRTHPDLIKNHMIGPGSFPELLSERIASKECHINYSKNFIEWKNRSRIHLCHCQYEHNVYNYKGAEIHVLMPDELTSFTEFMYRFLRGRVRLGGLKVPDKYKGKFPRIVSGTNPGDIGHNWVKASFIDNAPERQIVQMPKSEGGMRRQFIEALLEDNPTMMENDPDYEQRLEGLGDDALVRAMRHGDWDIVAGGMFDDLWRRDIHVIEPFEIPSSWYVSRSFDWGSSKPFSVGWWAKSDGTEATLKDGTKKIFPRGTLFRFDEWYGWNGKANEGSKMLAVEIADGIIEREKTFSVKVKAGPADSSIYDTENGNCIADDMAAKGVSWIKADKSPGSRKNGWELMRKMLKASIPKGNLPLEDAGLYVFSNCTQFIRTVPTLPRDKTKYDDVDTNAEDHIADETRYQILMPESMFYAF